MKLRGEEMLLLESALETRLGQMFIDIHNTLVPATIQGQHFVHLTKAEALSSKLKALAEFTDYELKRIKELQKCSLK